MRRSTSSASLHVDVLKYNYKGDHLMRGENIAFTLRVKVIPFKPALTWRRTRPVLHRTGLRP